MTNALSIISGTIEEARNSFSNVLADRTLSFDREAGFAVQILGSNDFAMKTATNNRQSVIDAVTNVAAIGISLNPARKQAYLVPRGGKICLDISYMGLLDLAIASGSILWGQAELVRDADVFALNGFDKPPTHVFNPFSKDRGEIVGVYVVVKTSSGDYLTTTMTIDECNDIRNRSEAWKRNGSGPWKTDPGEMIKKTVIKRASKLWPKSDRLDHAIHHLNTDGEGLESLAAPAKPIDWVDVAPMIAEAVATRTDADALAYWKANNPHVAKQPADHKKLKDAIANHRKTLQEKDQARTIEMPAAEPKPAVTAEAMAAFDETYTPE